MQLSGSPTTSCNFVFIWRLAEVALCPVIQAITEDVK